jgi:hypothetical protein
MPKPAPLALCRASLCLPLLARQGPSLPVLHLFNRLLVLRNLQARSPRTKPLPFSISTSSELGSVQHSRQLASVHTCRPVALPTVFAGHVGLLSALASPTITFGSEYTSHDFARPRRPLGCSGSKFPSPDLPHVG